MRCSASSPTRRRLRRLGAPAFIDSGGDTGDNADHVAAIDERRRLLGRMPRAVVNFPPRCGRGHQRRRRIVRQPSRMYGHSFADLLAIANIGVLVNVPGTQKFESTPRGSARPPRRGRASHRNRRASSPRMWSVVQPQWVTQVRGTDRSNFDTPSVLSYRFVVPAGRSPCEQTSSPGYRPHSATAAVLAMLSPATARAGVCRRFSRHHPATCTAR